MNAACPGDAVDALQPVRPPSHNISSVHHLLPSRFPSTTAPFAKRHKPCTPSSPSDFRTRRQAPYGKTSKQIGPSDRGFSALRGAHADDRHRVFARIDLEGQARRADLPTGLQVPSPRPLPNFPTAFPRSISQDRYRAQDLGRRVPIGGIARGSLRRLGSFASARFVLPCIRRWAPSF